MKNKGCFVYFLGALAGFAAVYWFFRAVYAIFLPESAAPLSLYHEHNLLLHDYYTVVPFGTLSARLLFMIMLTGVVWFLLWLVVTVVFKLLLKKTVPGFAANLVFYGMVLLLVYSLISTVFVPKRLVSFNTRLKQMEITDYNAIFYTWPNPFPDQTFAVEFNRIKEFRFAIYTEKVMGAGHLESDLLAITENDTICVGSTMLYHGEFGWITDWRSYDEISESGKREANEVAHFLEDLTGHSSGAD